MRVAQGIVIGWLTALMLFIALNGQGYDLCTTVAERDQLIYEAYRTCIERSDCRMTSQDWIDYYNLQWRLEK